VRAWLNIYGELMRAIAQNGKPITCKSTRSKSDINAAGSSFNLVCATTVSLDARSQKSRPEHLRSLLAP